MAPGHSGSSRSRASPVYGANANLRCSARVTRHECRAEKAKPGEPGSIGAASCQNTADGIGGMDDVYQPPHGRHGRGTQSGFRTTGRL
jgi:hypothetical protein